MAERGFRVLILEKVNKFTDRVRGEAITPWGVVEARATGVYDLLRDSCGHELPWLNLHLDGHVIAHRDLLATTPEATPFFAMSHPDTQEILLQAAEDAGADIKRGARATNIQPGSHATVTFKDETGEASLGARLVVGTDGRSPATRKWGGFEQQNDADRLVACGVLMESMDTPRDQASMRMNTEAGLMTFWFPQRAGTVRSYVVYQSDVDYRLSGDKSVPRFVEDSIKAGAHPDVYKTARAIGPLASFNGADNWVDFPYKDGVALVGDAAASSDSAWGEGIALALTDARILTEELIANEDWDEAGRIYAAKHDEVYAAVHTMEDWLTDILMNPSEKAKQRRARVMPLIAEDASRMPDLFALGPTAAHDETARRRFFGEE